MTVLPAIDIKNGKCVRLLQGDFNQLTDYNLDPLRQAEEFLDHGFSYLHVVDLDGAQSGSQDNLSIIKQLASNPRLKLEVGGGIRTQENIEGYLSQGVSAVVLGTKAVEEPDFLVEMAERFPSRIIIGLDAKQGKVATHGWANTEQVTAVDFAYSIKDLPLAGMVYTDIERDGMMSGLNIESTWNISKKSGIPTIASGGIHELSDVEALKTAFEGDADLFLGAITGRAIYEGSLDFKEGQALLDS